MTELKIHQDVCSVDSFWNHQIRISLSPLWSLLLNRITNTAISLCYPSLSRHYRPHWPVSFLVLHSFIQLYKFVQQWEYFKAFIFKFYYWASWRSVMRTDLWVIWVCSLQDRISEAEELDPIEPSSIKHVSLQSPLVPHKKYSSFKNYAIC